MNTRVHARQSGFTVIELLLVIVIFAAASVLFFVQKNNVTIAAADAHRKVSINAMYYSLEEVFYPANVAYPETINKDNLTSMDPELFNDPNGISLSDGDSDFRYEPTNCVDGKCKSYTLRSVLQNEADFVKESKNK